MRRALFVFLSGLAGAAVFAGCSSVPGTSTSTAPTLAAANSVPTPVQITSASLGAGDATVTIQATGSQPLSLSGWTLVVGTTPVQLPSDATIPAGQTLKIHTAAGANTGTDVYLGQNAQAIVSALQPGARVALQNPGGATVISFTVPNG
jgi:hypothetical protein